MGTALRVVCFGECMIELQGQAFGVMHQTYGGDSLNTAVYLARCGRHIGLQVDYATALGDDALSSGMLLRWQAEGVATALVRRLPGRLPGLYLIEVDEHGERRFSYWRDQAAARAYFEGPGDARVGARVDGRGDMLIDTRVDAVSTSPLGTTPLEQQADRIDALYLTGISLAILPPAGRDRLAAVAQAMRARGATVVFDNNYRPQLWPDAATARINFQRFLALATVALLTLDDEQALAGEPDANAQLRRTLALPCPEVVVKRGPASTLVRCAGKALQEVPTVRVAQVVDTTAAGDSFAGAYLAARLGGASAAAAALAGNRLAARVVQHRGAVIPLADMADLLAS